MHCKRTTRRLGGCTCVAGVRLKKKIIKKIKKIKKGEKKERKKERKKET